MRVLVVEDEPVFMESISLQLASDHIIVDKAKTAKRGLYKATVNKYNVIILDLNLPDGDGLSVCHDIRQQKVRTPVLMLTVRDEISAKVAGFSTGADDYMTKPYSPLELLARINALARRGTRQNTCIYRAKNIELQTRARRFIYKEQEVHLTRREFDLMQLFLEQEGEVIKREDMWETVWGWDEYPLHNTVDVHIKRLRDKIDDSLADRIKTVRGVGYRFDAE